MFRYRLTAYYEDKDTETRVAETVIVIAENDQQAVGEAKQAVSSDAVGQRVATLKVLEKAPITPGVVFRSDPYIPFQWPGQRALPKIAGQQPQA